MSLTRSLLLAIALIFISSCQANMSEEETTKAAATEHTSTIDCAMTKPLRAALQEGYRGLYPGVTRSDQIEKIVGKRVQWSSDGKVDIWYYPEFEIGIKAFVIKYVSYDTPAITLGELIKKYGCPDLILHVEPTGDEAPNYFNFVYFTRGLQFGGPGSKPIRLGDIVEGIMLFEPVVSTEEYFMEVLLSPEDTRTVSWDEAVEE